MDRYDMIQEFINYLVAYRNEKQRKLSARSIHSYLTGLRSYLGKNRIFIYPPDYKNIVVEPDMGEGNDEEGAINVEDIRKILLACSNKRLKAFLLVLSTGGPRDGETLSIRLQDIDFEQTPTKIKLRKEYTKTRKTRYFFITDEATLYLQDWIAYKYRPRDREQDNLKRQDTDLVFTVYNDRKPELDGIYKSLVEEFNLILKTLGMDERKEGMQHRKITMHKFRSFIYSKLSDIDSNFAEWLLGHKKSTYWKKGPEVKRLKYIEYTKHLTFLDFSKIDARSRDIESKFDVKEQEIQKLTAMVTQLNRQVEIFRPVIESLTDVKQCPKCKKMSINGNLTCLYCGRGVDKKLGIDVPEEIK